MVSSQYLIKMLFHAQSNMQIWTHCSILFNISAEIQVWHAYLSPKALILELIPDVYYYLTWSSTAWYNFYWKTFYDKSFAYHPEDDLKSTWFQSVIFLVPSFACITCTASLDFKLFEELTKHILRNGQKDTWSMQQGKRILEWINKLNWRLNSKRKIFNLNFHTRHSK